MKLNIKKINLVIILLFSFLAINFCSAAFIKDDVKSKINSQGIQAGAYGGYETVGPEGILNLVQTGVNVFLSVIGVLLLVYMLYAGYNWLTARGEEEKVEKAKDTLKRAITGAIIIVAAYAISVFVMYRLQAGALKGGALDSTPPPTPTQDQIQIPVEDHNEEDVKDVD